MNTVHDMLDQAREMPYGAAQIALLEQAIAHADAQHLVDEAFEARMLATTGYVYGGEPARSFVTFSWCLTEFDRDPVHHARWTHYVMWAFKSIVSGMTKFPEIPLARAADVLDDMERRWRAGGHSLHAVYAHRHLVARHVGDRLAAEEWYARWDTAPRDDLSDCVGCDPTSKAYWLADQGRDEEAIALAEPVLAGRLSCTEQPQAIYTALLQPYLRTGRLDAARDAHRRAYRVHRSHLADLSDIADHLEFCALTGNDALGLEIVERHLDWLDRAPTPWAAMRFAASSSLVLRRLDETGHGRLTVRDVKVGALAADLARRALDLAARFDLRNGTTHQSDQVRLTLATTPVAGGLRLAPPGSLRALTPSSDTGASSDGVQGGQPPSTVPRPTSDGQRDAAAPADLVPADLVPATAGPDELLERAEADYRAGREAAAFAAWEAFDARYREGQLNDRQRAMRADGAGGRAARDDDGTAAELAWRQAAGLFAAAGDEVRRQLVLGRLGMCLLRWGRPDEGRPLIAASTAHLSVHGTPDLLARAHLRLAVSHATAGRLAEAVASAGDAERHLDTAPDPATGGQLFGLKAQALGQLGEIGAAEESAAESRRRHRETGPPDDLAHACLLHGVSLRQLGRADEAVEAFDEALDQPCPPAVRRAVARHRAGVLAGTPRAAEAIAPLVEEVAALTAEGDRDTVAYVQHELAIAYLNAGDPLDAAQLAEEALAAFEAAGDDQALATRDLLVAVYEALAEHDAVLAQLAALAEAVRARGDHASLARASERTAETLDKLDRDATAAAHFAEAAAAHAEAGFPVDAARARRRHMTSLLWAGQVPAALAALAEADAALPDDPDAGWERAMLDYDAARVLDQAERPAEAVDRAGRAVTGFRAVGAATQTAWSGLRHGQLLAAAGRPAEAAGVLRQALSDLPPDDDEGHARIEAALAALPDGA